MTRLGETVSVRNMSSPRSGIGCARSPTVARICTTGLASAITPSAISCGIEPLVKAKRARTAYLQIGTAGGAAHRLPEGFGGRPIDDMDRKGERDADRDGESGQHKAHRKGAQLTDDQPAPGDRARFSHRRAPGHAA